MGSPDAANMVPRSAMPCGTFPERIPQPGAGYGSPRQLESQTAMATGMRPQPVAGYGSPRQDESQASMATGVRRKPCSTYGSLPKPCSSYGSSSQFGSLASMASEMR